MTHGDSTNCKCPHCGKNNVYVTHGLFIAPDKITEFTKTCEHCKKLVYYWARWSITVEAEKESKVI